MRRAAEIHGTQKKAKESEHPPAAMFSINEPATPTALARMQSYRQVYINGHAKAHAHRADTGMDARHVTASFPLVPPPVPTRPVPASEAAWLARMQPLITTSREQVKKAYPAPPVDAAKAQANAVRQAAAAASAGQKRARAGGLSHSGDGAAADVRNRGSGKDGDVDGDDLVPTHTAQFAPDMEKADYLGRSFLQPPVTLVQLAESGVQKANTIPRTQRGVFRDNASAAAASSTASVAGVQLVRWAPPAYGHLLFSADIQGGVKLWNSATRKHMASYDAHRHPVKSLDTVAGATLMSSGATDGTIALWDVESGALRSVLTNPDALPVHQHLHHPSSAAGDLVLAAVDRRVALYDVRASTSKYQREYTGHMGAIFHLGLLSGGSKLLTTSEDRSMRTWDFRVPVQIKQFADASMHAITHVVQHPHSDLLAAQSLDNKVIVFKDEGGGRLKLLQGKSYSGHIISGTRCQLAFSPDGVYLTSGDISGKLFVWNWSTGEMVRAFKAHTGMLVSHAWHPLEACRVVTSGWDGAVKNWG